MASRGGYEPRGRGGRGGFGGPPRGGYQGGPPGGGFGGYGAPGGNYGGPGGPYGGPPGPGGPPQAGGYGGYPPFGGPGGPGGYPPGPGGPPEPQSPLDEEIQLVIAEIQAEMSGMEQAGEWGDHFKNARRLLSNELERLENNVDPEWLEVDIPKSIKVTKKILIPNYRYPKFNFVGKILGPKGATLQNLAKTFKCHIYVLGRGSTKDAAKEQEQLNSGDPQFAHFGGPLHVKVETIAPPHIAYKRVASVIEEMQRILQPVREDTTPEFMKKEDGGDGEDTKSGNETPQGGPPSQPGGGYNQSRGGGPMRGGGGFRGRGMGRGGRGRPGPY